MRRINREKYALHMQMISAVRGITGEPGWPAGAPTAAQAQALADELDQALTDLVAVENDMSGVRFRTNDSAQRCRELLRRIDNITSGLYGIDGAAKISYGLRPIDTTRNSPGPTPKVAKLALSDGKAAGSIQADWKRVPRAVYEAQWFADEELAQLLGSAATTRSELLIPALAPGTQVWVRVRALRSRKQGEWSDARTRIANVV